MNLFLAFTPNHLMMTKISSDYRQGDIIVLLDQTGKLFKYSGLKFQDFFDGNLFYFDLRNNKNFLKKVFSLNKFLSIIYLTPLNKFVLEKKNSNFDEVFVFNDSAFEAQYIISEFSHKSVCYIEDGAAPYNDHYLGRSKIGGWISKMLIGFYVDPCNVLGTSKYISRSMFSFPDLTREENRVRPYSEFSIEANYIDILKSFYFSLEVDAGLIDLKGSYDIAIFPKLTGNRDSHKILEMFQTAMGRGSGGNSFLVKTHPLDDVLDLASSRVRMRIPSEIPIELVPALGLDIAKVIGTDSTALLLMRRFYPNIKILSFFSKNDRFSVVMKSVGILKIN